MENILSMLKRTSNILEIKNLYKNFDGVRALQNFSCTVCSKEIVGLIGPNGAGKSTLFNIVCGYVPCNKGNIIFQGGNILGKSPRKIAALGIARSFQNLRLIQQMTLLDNVMLSYKNQKGEYLKNIFFKKKESQGAEIEIRNKSISLLDKAGITDKAEVPVSELSYGHQKMLSIVRSIAIESDLFLLDEPIAGLSSNLIHRVLTMIYELRKGGKSVFIIDHNIDIIMQICDRAIFMDEGKIICEGSPEIVRNDINVINAYLK